MCTVDGTSIRDTAELLVVPGPLATLTISPGEATVQAGTSQLYQAGGADAYGNEIDDVIDQTVFSINPSYSCTTVGAEVSCTKARLYTVIGTFKGTSIRDTAELLVVPGPLATLTISPGEATVQAGTSQLYQAGGADAYGNETPDVIEPTIFSIKESNGSCTEARCGATQP